MKKIIIAFCMLLPVISQAQERELIWPERKMPDRQKHQVAAMTAEMADKGFKRDKHRVPYIEWYAKPEESVRDSSCMILISGGAYECCCDNELVSNWAERFTKLGVQCVNFVYRTPRPEGIPIYQTAWEDGQRAVRMVRSEAAKRGFNPEKIGVIGMSAGSHLALLLASSSQTPAYGKIDDIDDVPCHINWAIANAPAYLTTDGETGEASRNGYGPDVRLSGCFKFDEKTCPVSLHHGGRDPYSPNGSTLFYRELRRRGIPAELHLYPKKGHGAFGFDRAVEFMKQLGFLGRLEEEEKIMKRFPSDEQNVKYTKQNIWPEGRTPDFQERQNTPYLEWYVPDNLKTRAIQIIYSGGSYEGNDPNGFEVAPVRRFLNAKGMAVVTLKYRTPRPSAESGLSKHTNAWQDLQRAVRIVRSEAQEHGLDPDHIGIMGSSAGGHLTLMGATSSLHQSYNPIDKTDKLPCNVQWGIAIYPAYVLTDGANGENIHNGNDEGDSLVEDFSFDVKSAPLLMIHGDKDRYSAMGSVKIWEKMRSMGVQCELHTLAGREHCFNRNASPDTGSYNYLDRIEEYLRKMGVFKKF